MCLNFARNAINVLFFIAFSKKIFTFVGDVGAEEIPDK